MKTTFKDFINEEYIHGNIISDEVIERLKKFVGKKIKARHDIEFPGETRIAIKKDTELTIRYIYFLDSLGKEYDSSIVNDANHPPFVEFGIYFEEQTPMKLMKFDDTSTFCDRFILKY